MKSIFSICIGSLALIAIACDQGKNTGSNVNDGPRMDSSDMNASNTQTMNLTPFTKEDSAFVMEAALGSLMEIESGNIARQQAAHARIKNFGAMMVTDHTKASEELKNLVSGRGMILPSALPQNLQQHMEGMRKMQGSSFDRHYMQMMVDDHQKTIQKFEAQASSGGDAQIKSWASAQLPILKKHLDSARAISQGVK